MDQVLIQLSLSRKEPSIELAEQTFKHYRYRKKVLGAELSVEERQRLALLNVGTGYILLHQLREGKFSTVWLALAAQRLPLNDPNGKYLVAVKVATTQQNSIGDRNRQMLVKEGKILSTLHQQGPEISRNVVVMHEQFGDGVTWQALVMELASGSLADSMESAWKEDEARAVFAPIVRLLERIQSKVGIIHCDVKPSNVLVYKDGPHRKDWHCKMCDFGLSHSMPAGTLQYLSLERLNSDFSAIGDTWALGVLIYEALHQRKPFGLSEMRDRDQVVRALGSSGVELEFDKHLSESCRSLLAGLLAKNPRNRLDMRQAASHPFWQNSEEEEEAGMLPSSVRPKKVFEKICRSSDRAICNWLGLRRTDQERRELEHVPLVPVVSLMVILMTAVIVGVSLDRLAMVGAPAVWGGAGAGDSEVRVILLGANPHKLRGHGATSVVNLLRSELQQFYDRYNRTVKLSSGTLRAGSVPSPSHNSAVSGQGGSWYGSLTGARLVPDDDTGAALVAASIAEAAGGTTIALHFELFTSERICDQGDALSEKDVRLIDQLLLSGDVGHVFVIGLRIGDPYQHRMGSLGSFSGCSRVTQHLHTSGLHMYPVDIVFSQSDPDISSPATPSGWP